MTGCACGGETQVPAEEGIAATILARTNESFKGAALTVNSELQYFRVVGRSVSIDDDTLVVVFLKCAGEEVLPGIEQCVVENAGEEVTAPVGLTEIDPCRVLGVTSQIVTLSKPRIQNCYRSAAESDQMLGSSITPDQPAASRPS